MKQNLDVEHLDTIANETNCPIVVDNSAVVDQCECGKPKMKKILIVSSVENISALNAQLVPLSQIACYV